MSKWECKISWSKPHQRGCNFVALLQLLVVEWKKAWHLAPVAVGYSSYAWSPRKEKKWRQSEREAVELWRCKKGMELQRRQRRKAWKEGRAPQRKERNGASDEVVAETWSSDSGGRLGFLGFLAFYTFCLETEMEKGNFYLKRIKRNEPVVFDFWANWSWIYMRL